MMMAVTAVNTNRYRRVGTARSISPGTSNSGRGRFPPVEREGLKTLLSTVEGETLAWKQVHRACHKLEELTNGEIEFKKTAEYGWILVMRDTEYLTRVVSAGNGG